MDANEAEIELIRIVLDLADPQVAVAMKNRHQFGGKVADGLARYKWPSFSCLRTNLNNGREVEARFT